MADSDVYDDESGGLGTPSGSAPPDADSSKTYAADPETAAAETSEADSDTTPSTDTAAEQSKAASLVKGGLEQMAKKTPVGKFLGGKAKVYVGGVLVFFIGIIAVALFTFNLPSATIQAAGNSLSHTYLGATIVANSTHLDTFISETVSKIRTTGLTEMCATDGCVVESKLKGTKLGKYGFTLKQRVIAANEKVGTNILTDGSGKYTGVRIDTKNDKSAFYKDGGSSADQLRSALVEAGAGDFAIEEVEKGVFNVVDESITKFGRSDLFTVTVKESGFIPDVLSKTSGVRSLAKSLGLGFHPLQALRKVSDWEKGKSQAIADWLDSRNKNIVAGDTADSVSISGPKDATENAPKVEETAGKGSYRSALDTVHGITDTKAGATGATAAGATLLLQGALCMVRAYYTAKDGVVTSNNIPTAMRSAQDYMSAAEQTQAVSSPDLDSEAVDAYVSNVLEKKNSDGSVDSFSNSLEFGNLNGTSAGTPTSSDIDLMLGNTSDVSPAMKNVRDLAMGGVGATLCEGAGGLLTAGAGIVLAVVSDGVLTAAGGVVVGALAGVGVEQLGNLVAKTLNPINYGPAQNYNIGGSGAAYLASASNWSNGGSFQSATSQAALSQVYATSLQQDFANKSLAYRLFHTNDERSLFGQIAVRNTSNLSTNLARMTQQLTRGSLLASSVSKIANGSAYAAPAYDPCTKPLGGCVNLSTAVMRDPGTNAAAVLNGPSSQKYIDLMSTCHDISFTKDSEGDWTTSVLGYGSYMKAAVSKTAPAECANIESDPAVVALLSYTNLESQLALSVCMTAPEGSTSSTDASACERAGYGASSKITSSAKAKPTFTISRAAKPSKTQLSLWLVPVHTDAYIKERYTV